MKLFIGKASHLIHTSLQRGDQRLWSDRVTVSTVLPGSLKTARKVICGLATSLKRGVNEKPDIERS
jgi:hypothetical protein